MNKPEYLNCSADVVGGLIETVAVSLMDNFPSSTVDTEDVGMVLDALHVLRPDAPELDALDGIMSIVAGRYDDAVRILSQVTETAPRFTYARALLAFSLAAKGDPAWRQHAGEVLDDHDAGDAQKLVRVLIARHDLMNARRASKMGAGFVMPESVTALLDTQQGSTAARPASAPREQAAVDMHHQMGFLRA